jgi:ubiquinone/menaquinone biosynthesis C-methylase UbiE
MITNDASEKRTNKHKDFYNEIYKGHQYALLEREDQINNYKEVKQVIDKYFPDKKPLTLEIGCGRGMFKDITEKYIGIDISHTVLDKMKNKIRLVASGENMPFKNNSFDFIFSIFVIEHFIQPEYCLMEIERLLKPGGISCLKPAWYCNSWTVKGLAHKKWKDINFQDKLSKLLIPIRNHFYYRFFKNIPRRAISHFHYSLFKEPVRLEYKRLFPDYKNIASLSGEFIPDSDATCALDPYDTMLYFLSRGYEILSEKNIKTMIFADFPAVLIRKP